jgi:hypothetical protein
LKGKIKILKIEENFIKIKIMFNYKGFVKGFKINQKLNIPIIKDYSYMDYINELKKICSPLPPSPSE